jgi:hypothetical protein
MAHLAAALYWFNPLIWLAVRRLRREREHACDDLVLNAGLRASEYAKHLLAITRSAHRPGISSVAAVAMARRSGMAGRIRAVLDGNRNRRAVPPRSVAAAVAAIVCLLIPIARVQALGAVKKAPTQVAEDAAGRPIYLWDANESWPGGSQHDPRLDQSVSFWRAGISLAEVFTGVASQTEVVLDFWPSGDEAGRIRMNLYLNAGSPPSLRDLMVQIMWVTDRDFGWVDSERGASGPIYYLLSGSGGVSNLGLAAVERRAEERVTEARQQRSDFPDQDELKEVVRGSLEELRQALELPKDELIARHRGGDDYLLFTLTDPQRRAVAQYVCGSIPEDFEPPPRHEEWSKRKWDDLSAEERSLVRTALDIRQDSEVGLLEEAYVEIWVEYSGTSLVLTAVARTGPGWGGSGTTWTGLGHTKYVAPTRERALTMLEDLDGRSLLRFARSLGEDIPEDREQAYVERWRAEISATRRGRDLENLAARAGISPTTAELLSSLDLPLGAGRPYALWEVQETVAAVSGMNVVSDCYWQPRRPLDKAGSALEAVAAASRQFPQRARDLWDKVWLAGWEWGDAGSFIRFRSIDRDAWQASLLPADVLAAIDAHLEPYLPEPAAAEWPGAGISMAISLDPFELIRLASPLDDLQLSYGGRLIYEDPSDAAEACRQALREAFLDVAIESRPDALNASRHLNRFRLMASLTPEQWEAARGPGMKATEFTPEQLDRVANAVAFWDVHEEQLSILRLKAAHFVSENPRRRGERLWFYVTLVLPKEARNWTVPEEHQRDLNLFYWRCDDRASVDVPRPLRPALLPQGKG